MTSEFSFVPCGMHNKQNPIFEKSNKRTILNLWINNENCPFSNVKKSYWHVA